MFDIGWTEMLVVAIVAILFVGPKELPAMLRTFGRAIKKMRGLAGDFQKQFDEALKEAELDGLKNAVNDVRNLDPTKAIKDKLNPLKSDLEDVKKSVESKSDFDPAKLFDETKDRKIDGPVTVDVDAALERQRKLDEEKAKLPPSSGKNAVPGFGGAPAKADAGQVAEVEPVAEKAEKPAARKSTKAASPKAGPKPTKAADGDKPTRKTSA